MPGTISVVCITHNVEKYVDDLVGSLRRNVDDGVEFVVVDDGSSDTTQDRLSELLDDLPDATLVTHEVSKGASAARNTGIRTATGDRVLFIDGDDWIAPTYVRDLRRRSEELDVDVLRVGLVRDENGKRTVQWPPCHRLDQAMDSRDLIFPVSGSSMVDYPYPVSAVFRRSLDQRGLLHFDETLRTAEDREWTWRWMSGGVSLAVSRLNGYFYRRGVAGSLTQVADDRQFDFIPSTRRTVELLASDPEMHRFLPKARRTQFALVYFHHLKRARLPKHLRVRLRQETHQLLREVPWDEFRATATEMGAVRASFLTARRAGVL